MSRKLTPTVTQVGLAAEIQQWPVIQDAHVVRGYMLEKDFGAGKLEDDELLHMDADGDTLNAGPEMHVETYPCSVYVAVAPDVASAEAVRLLRKIAAAIEAEGLPSAFVVYTEHPIARRHGIQDGAS